MLFSMIDKNSTKYLTVCLATIDSPALLVGGGRGFLLTTVLLVQFLSNQGGQRDGRLNIATLTLLGHELCCVHGGFKLL